MFDIINLYYNFKLKKIKIMNTIKYLEEKNIDFEETLDGKIIIHDVLNSEICKHIDLSKIVKVSDLYLRGASNLSFPELICCQGHANLEGATNISFEKLVCVGNLDLLQASNVDLSALITAYNLNLNNSININLTNLLSVSEILNVTNCKDLNFRKLNHCEYVNLINSNNLKFTNLKKPYVVIIDDCKSLELEFELIQNSITMRNSNDIDLSKLKVIMVELNAFNISNLNLSELTCTCLSNIRLKKVTNVTLNKLKFHEKESYISDNGKYNFANKEIFPFNT